MTRQTLEEQPMSGWSSTQHLATKMGVLVGGPRTAWTVMEGVTSSNVSEQKGNRI